MARFTKIKKAELERYINQDRIICPECDGRGVYEAGFKHWATCKECRGKKYIESSDSV